MSTRKTGEEQLQELDKKLEQLKVQKQNLIKREQEKTRKERTRRLIQIGALSEKYFNCNTDIESFEKMLNEVVKLDSVKRIILDNTEL